MGLESRPDAEIGRDGFQRQLWHAARTLLGDAGSAAVDLDVPSFAFADGVGDAVVRTRRDEVGRARAAVACVDAVGDVPVGVTVRGVSGTVRACEEKYIRRPQESADERTVAFEDDPRRAVARGERVDVRVDDTFAGATALDFDSKSN